MIDCHEYTHDYLFCNKNDKEKITKVTSKILTRSIVSIHFFNHNTRYRYGRSIQVLKREKLFKRGQLSLIDIAYRPIVQRQCELYLQNVSEWEAVNGSFTQMIVDLEERPFLFNIEQNGKNEHYRLINNSVQPVFKTILLSAAHI